MQILCWQKNDDAVNDDERDDSDDSVKIWQKLDDAVKDNEKDADIEEKNPDSDDDGVCAESRK